MHVSVVLHRHSLCTSSLIIIIIIQHTTLSSSPLLASSVAISFPREVGLALILKHLFLLPAKRTSLTQDVFLPFPSRPVLSSGSCMHCSLCWISSVTHLVFSGAHHLLSGWNLKPFTSFCFFPHSSESFLASSTSSPHLFLFTACFYFTKACKKEKTGRKTIRIMQHEYCRLVPFSCPEACYEECRGVWSSKFSLLSQVNGW